MFKQLNTNDLKATNGGIIPVIVWAFAYDRSRAAEARRQDEERRKAEERIANEHKATMNAINNQHKSLDEQEELLNALDTFYGMMNK